MKILKNKKGWMHIMEAFVSVMLVMSVVMIVTVQNRPVINTADEMSRLQRYTLDYVSSDNLLRGQVLGGYLGGVNDKLKPLIPVGYNYSIKLCTYNLTYNDICSLGFIVSEEVYSDETLLFANLTYFNPESAVKLKIFFWKGNYPEGVSPPDYYVNKPEFSCSDDCSGLVDTRCFNSTSYQTCGDFDGDGCYEWGSDSPCGAEKVCQIPTGLCIFKDKTAVLDLKFSGTVYSWDASVSRHKYTHTRTWTETNGVGVTLTQGQLCYLDGTCDAKGTVNYRISSNNNLVTNNNYFRTSYASDKFTLTYWGIDDNGHAVTVVQKMCVSGMSFVENCA